MASLLHEGLLDLFRSRPRLAPELLRDTLHAHVPEFDDVRVAEANLTDLVPAEFRADLVLFLESGAGTPPQGAIVVEVRLSTDADKRWSWPVYLAGLRARHRCGAALLVITSDEAIATWAGRGIDMGHPDFVLTPLVLGPASVPVVDDEAAAIRAPDLAVLSTLVHSQGPAAATIGAAAFAALRGLDDERARLYLDLILGSVNDAARAILEGLMASSHYEYRSDFAKKYYAEGRAEGRVEGHAEGRALGEAHAVLEVLRARGIEVPGDVRARILACTDLAALETWIARAVTARSAAEVVGES